MIAQAAVEEGIVVGGGCTLLRLASKVDAIKETLENDEQKVDDFAEIFHVKFCTICCNSSAEKCLLLKDIVNIIF